MSSSIESLITKEYEAGFVTEVESDTLPPGLSEETVRTISEKKNEPGWMLEWRLKALRRWQSMHEPHWPNVKYAPIDYQSISYYSAPKKATSLASLDEVRSEERRVGKEGRCQGLSGR